MARLAGQRKNLLTLESFVVTAGSMNAAAIQQMNKQDIVSRWRSLQGRLARMKETAEGVAERGANAAVQGTSFTVSHVARRVMQLKGMKTGFGSQQQADGFLIAGIIGTVIGVSPWGGKYGSLLASGGMGMACAGSVDLLDKAAAYLVSDS